MHLNELFCFRCIVAYIVYENNEPITVEKRD